MRYRVHTGKCWRKGLTLEEAKAICEAVFAKTKIVLCIEEDR